MSTKKRKTDHIDICLQEEVEFSKKSTGFEKVGLRHEAVPEVDFKSVDLSTDFLGERINLPIQVSGMTGGTERGKKINKNLARAAEDLGFVLGVGSQRVAIEKSDLEDTFSVVREEAPNAFIIANIGAVQLNYGYGMEELQKAVDMIEADALALHFNVAQEAIQPGGDKNFSNLIPKVEEICEKADFPVIAKESGCGFAGDTARRLEKAGVSAIDIQGAGGTSFAKVENYRASSNFGESILEWGIPTLRSLKECIESTDLPLIASGGIRSGTDIAKSLALGSDLAGVAKPMLKPALDSPRRIKEELSKYIEELRTSMFLTGSENIKELKESKLDLVGL